MNKYSPGQLIVFPTYGEYNSQIDEWIGPFNVEKVSIELERMNNGTIRDWVESEICFIVEIICDNVDFYDNYVYFNALFHDGLFWFRSNYNFVVLH
jgi:hypothetical protein